MTERRGPIRVSVGGGKGGVGKSVVAVNLATALASLGVRTVLVDADLGTPTLHTLLGVDHVGKTIGAFLDRRIARLEEAMVGTGIARLSLVAGTSTPGAANPSHQEKLKLVRHVRALDADVVVIDVGAGTSFNTLDLFGAGDVRLVVATPELTSLQNAYCFVRAALTRELVAVARDHGVAEAWTAVFDGRETARLGPSVARFEREHPRPGATMRRHMRGFGARWVGNRVADARGLHALHALSRMTRDFLATEVPFLAAVPAASAVERSIAMRSPVMAGGRVDPALARAFETMVEHVLAAEPRADTLVEESGVSPVPSEAPDAFAERLGPHQRREERVPTHVPVHVEVEGWSGEGVIADLSRGGARVVTSAHARVGARVTLRTTDAAAVVVEGTVRHASGGSLGVELDPGAHARIAKHRQRPSATAA